MAEMQKVDPNSLRFSQDSIAAYIRKSEEELVPLSECLKLLECGKLSPSDLPKLDISKAKDGILWSDDNRRLWLFRKARIKEIQVNVYSTPLKRAPPKEKKDRDVMSKEDYFPRVREKLEAAYPDALRFSQASISPYVLYEGKEVALSELRTKLESGKLKPSAFGPLNIYRDPNEVLWSNDNGELWLLRKAKIKEKIQVRIYEKLLNRAPPPEEDRHRMSKPDFFPEVDPSQKPSKVAKNHWMVALEESSEDQLTSDLWEDESSEDESDE